jgi:hypothetical protein
VPSEGFKFFIKHVISLKLGRFVGILKNIIISQIKALSIALFCVHDLFHPGAKLRFFLTSEHPKSVLAQSIETQKSKFFL